MFIGCFYIIIININVAIIVKTEMINWVIGDNITQVVQLSVINAI